MKPLKIAIFTPSFLPKCSGAEIFHHNLASHLVAAGHEVTVIAPRRNVRALQGKALPYQLIGFPSNVWSLLKRWPALGLWVSRRVLNALQRRGRFEVWHAVVTYPTGVAFIDWQSRRGDIAGLLRSVGDDLSNAAQGVGLRRNPQVDLLVRRLLPKAQAAVALSAEMQADYLALGLPAERIHHIGNAVDLKRFARPVDRDALRATLGLERESFLFLSVGRHHPQKDFPTLLRACALLKDAGSRPFKLFIVGRGSRELAPMVDQLGLQEIVELREAGAADSLEFPPQPLVDLYRAADCFVMSSLLEGFSSALLEAMAAALPVITTDAPGCIDFVRHGADASVVPRENPPALAAAMRQLLDDPARAHALSACSLARASQFSWENAVARYVELYRTL